VLPFRPNVPNLGLAFIEDTAHNWSDTHEAWNFGKYDQWVPANYGAWYVSQILDALTANPEVFSKTAFFLNYDENDGLFDHMVPPTPPQSRAQGLSTSDPRLGK
jgi:phospholipase C